MSAFFWLILLIFESNVQKTFEWGSEGHAIVVRLGESRLTKEASDWTKSLLPWFLKGNLTAAASWPDDIIHSNSNYFDYLNWLWSRTLHYIDVPDWTCNYNVKRDCINDVCIDGALRNYSNRIVLADIDHVQHQEALMFLIHFVGDVHQPLHVSFAGDQGGNKVQGHYMNSSRVTNLHSLWDSGLIHTRLERDFRSDINSYYEYLYKRMQELIPTSNDDDFNQWIDESLMIVCRQVYIDENNVTMNSSSMFRLGNVYYEKNIPVLEQRLIQGGYRLGSLLNKLASKRPKSPSSSSTKLHWSTIALIVVLGIEFILIIVFIGRRYCLKRQESNVFSFSTHFSK